MSTTHPRLLIGGYTPEMEGRATGITTLETGPDATTTIGTLELPSPTYLITHPDQPWIFAVTEGQPSRLSSAVVADDGTLTLLSQVQTDGDFACHLALAPDHRHLVVAHYGSGSVASVRLEADGRLSEQVDLWTFAGTGPDPERQEGPHAHQVVFDGDELLVADLGTDQIHRLRLDPEGRFRTAAAPVQLPAGSGPRHLVIIEDHLVVGCELSGDLWVGVRTTDGWQQTQLVAGSSAETSERIAPSALRSDGDTVFMANRGAGTIASFTLDRVTHFLSPLAEFDCGGPGPRDLVVRSDGLWVANQTSDVITVLDRDGGAVATITSPSPACIVILEPSAAR
ncbi:MAG TPA: beta-propeller fold lactonase family protein [Propionibacteriaceae bacterium]